MIALHLTKFVATHCDTPQGGNHMVPHVRDVKKGTWRFYKS